MATIAIALTLTGGAVFLLFVWLALTPAALIGGSVSGDSNPTVVSVISGVLALIGLAIAVAGGLLTRRVVPSLFSDRGRSVRDGNHD